MKSKEIIKKIEREISKIKNVQAVYLFGSVARGEENQNSDIDLCVIGNLNNEEKWKILSMGNDKVEIVLFNDLPIYIKIKIFSEGKPLFIKNENAVSLIKLITLKQYRDFYPLIEKRLRRMLEYV